MRISDWSSDVCSSDLPSPALPCLRRGGSKAASEFAVVTLFQGVEQVGGGVHLAVVFDLLVAWDFHHGAVVELEAVGGVGKVGLLDQHALEGGGVEADGGAALESFLVGVAVGSEERRVGKEGDS